MRGDITEMRGDITGLQKDNKEIHKELRGMRGDITAINLKLENVIEPQIGFLADGHKDLMRKMNEVLEIHRDREMNLARLSKVEIEVDLLKQKMKHSA